MKKIISSFITILFISNPVFACDFSKDIQKTEDGSYTYTKDCHITVGKTVKKLGLKEQQVDKLEEVIELKDLAIVKGHERIDLWMNTSFKLEDRVNTIDRLKERNKWLYFGLGIIVTGAAVWGAGQLK